MSEERNYNFQKLTPTDKVDLGIYADALDKVFIEEDIKNVAISGAYSAGKSSVLESYKKAHPEKKFLNISLAHFEDAKVEPSSDKSLPNLSNKNKVEKDEKSDEHLFSIESILEGKILNQLIHQIDPDKILQTNFRVKQKVSKLCVVIDAALVVLSTVALLFTLFFNEWTNFITSSGKGRVYSLFEFSTHPVIRILAGVAPVLVATVFVYRFIKLQKTKNIIKKISVKGTDIEILGENRDSYFDRYLNEVLYLFDNSQSDVIVFEDMDRYDTNQIFARLREINALINAQRKRKHEKLMNFIFMKWLRSAVKVKSKKSDKADSPNENTSKQEVVVTSKIEKKKKLDIIKLRLEGKIPTYKPLRFFYLLRDDIFVTKDRTKFFDFIMPVVPIIDCSNSYDIFIAKFKAGGIYDEFDPHFLQKLSLYVDDMRLLLNIYNEFIVYESRIHSTEQDWNKMLAMITYKNLFPRDFSELQLGKGFIYNLFKYKQNFIESEIEEQNMQIIELRSNIAFAKDVYAETAKEVEQIASTLKAGINERYRYNNNIQSQTELTTVDDVAAKRKGYIGSRKEEKIDELNTEIESAQKQIALLKTKRTLVDIITRDNIDMIFKNLFFENDGKERTEFLEIKKSPYFDLLKFLLRNGHIDESYPDYMTYFYPNSLSVEDKNFLRSVTDKKAKEVYYKIKNPQLVLSYLSVADFKQPEILNVFVFKLLLRESARYKDYLDALFSYLIHETNMVFFVEYIRYEDAIADLVKQTCSRWTDFVKLFIGHRRGGNDDSYKVIALNSFIFTLFDCGTNNEVQCMNVENCLTEYIQTCCDFLEFGEHSSTFKDYNHNRKNELLNILIKSFDLIGVKFKAIDYDAANKELFRQVYEHNQYELNRDNIWLMLKTMYGPEEDTDFVHRNLSIIMTNKDSPLSKYVWANINEYLQVVFSFCDDKITEDDQVALKIINNEVVESTILHKYLELLKTAIKNLSDVTNESIWEKLLSLNLCENTQANVLAYFDKNSLDDVLVKFINNHNPLGYKGITFVTQQSRDKFFREVIINNDIANDRYSLIVTSMNLYYDQFSFKNISQGKIEILINSNTVRMNADTLPIMRENYPNNLMHYIEKNIAEYVALMSDGLFIFDEALSILDLSIEDKHKIELLKFTNEPISVLNKSYTATVKAYILTNNYDENDLNGIITQYVSETAIVKAVIENIAIDNIERVLANEIAPPTSLFNALLYNVGLTIQNKLGLFSLIVGRLEIDQFRGYLPPLGLEEYNKVFERKQVCIPNTSIHERILSIICDNKHWISSYKTDDKDDDFIRAYPFIPHKDKKKIS